MKNLRDPSTKTSDNQAVFLFVITMLLVFLITLSPPADLDMWWHLSAGRAMWNNGEILQHDIFSYTRGGEPWTNAFWISDLLIFFFQSTGGFLAVALWASSMAVLTMAVVYKHAESPKVIRVLVIVLAAFAMAPVWSARPQLFSFFLLALLDYFLSRKGESLNKSFWLLLPLFAIWPNLHGGFIFGFLLLAAFIVAKLVEPLLQNIDNGREHQKRLSLLMGITIVSGLIVGLNPNGLAIWKLPFYTVDVSMMIREWQSPNFHRLDLHPILWLLFLVMIGWGCSRRKISLFDLFKTLGFAYMTLYSQRSMALFAIIAAPVAARSLAVTWEDWKSAPIGLWLTRLQKKPVSKPLPGRLTKILNITIVILVFVVIFFHSISLSSSALTNQYFPSGAVAWINDNRPQGRLFNSYNWGGYLTWELQDYPLFIDGRADLYGHEIIKQWEQIIQATDEGFTLLDEWDIQLILVEPEMKIVDALPKNEWSVLYQDDVSILLGRSR